jgi:hypothetical protein
MVSHYNSRRKMDGPPVYQDGLFELSIEPFAGYHPVLPGLISVLFPLPSLVASLSKHQFTLNPDSPPLLKVLSCEF